MLSNNLSYSIKYQSRLEKLNESENRSKSVLLDKKKNLSKLNIGSSNQLRLPSNAIIPSSAKNTNSNSYSISQTRSMSQASLIPNQNQLVLNDIPVTVKSPDTKKYSELLAKGNTQFQETVVKQLEFFYKLHDCFDEIYSNFLNLNEQTIMATTRMIRFLSVLVRNEQSMIDDLKMPIMLVIHEKCSKNLVKELEIKPIVIRTAKLYDTRDSKVEELKNELKKIEKKIKRDLIEHNSIMSKQEEKELKK